MSNETASRAGVDIHDPGRDVMTSEELRAHALKSYGRDYSKSDNGYDDMSVNEAQGWHTLSGWGRDGWDMGDWPYQVYSVRIDTHDGFYDLLEVCEGDHTVYRFDNLADLYAACDLVFWDANETVRELVGAPYDEQWRASRPPVGLDVRYRGPFSWDRLNRFNGEDQRTNLEVDGVVIASVKHIDA